MLGGCSSWLIVELLNDGPGPATVTLRYQEGERKVERIVEVPERGTDIQGLWSGAEPQSLEVEVKWPKAVRRQTFARPAIIEGLQVSGSGSSVHGLSVSPERIRWVKPTLWVRLQNPALIPAFLFFFVFGISRWIRWRVRQGSATPR